MAFRVSMPFIPGSRRSSRTTSGSIPAILRTASSPEPRRKRVVPRRFSSFAMTPRKAESSSTSRIFKRKPPAGRLRRWSRGRARCPPENRRHSRGRTSSVRNRPSPVPPLRRLKKGSKMRARSSGAIPQPLSATRMRTDPAAARRETVTRPPGAQACTALSVRLINAFCNSASSARTWRVPRAAPPRRARNGRARWAE